MKYRLQTNWGTKFAQLLTLLDTFALLLLRNPAAEAQKMYWTDNRGIYRADLDGGSRETLLSVTLSRPNGITVWEQSATSIASDAGKTDGKESHGRLASFP